MPGARIISWAAELFEKAVFKDLAEKGTGDEAKRVAVCEAKQAASGAAKDTAEDVGQDTSATAARRELSDGERQLLAQRRAGLAAQHPEDYENFSKDPDHRTKKGEYRIRDSHREEAKTALDLREQGKLPADIQRPPKDGEGDFYSPSRKEYYDIKEVSDTPPREFNAARTEKNISDQLRDGRTPIIDTSGASQPVMDQLAEIIKKNGWDNRVIWYP
ncbi:MAG: hypothetical protein ACM3ML_23150 [Micromonosporaceae bacterium]